MKRVCPLCSTQFNDSDGNIYCPNCGAIADSDVLLSEKIKPSTAGGSQTKKPVQKSRYDDDTARPKLKIDDDNAPKKLETETPNHTPLIIIAVLVIVAAAAYYFFF